jgi:isopentenyl diphosphate isomerase/L-lactate dehydrogenase-like FMN-dependent dehydrogenase
MKFVCIDDYETAARQRLDKQAYDYYRSGADDERTLRANREAFNGCGSILSALPSSHFTHLVFSAT